jgi:2-polyprenyl-3-methyl-5-hydroxy-6-metoxy-1,4-benzoquinol methylase
LEDAMAVNSQKELVSARRWANMVRAEHEQAERVRQGSAAEDYWKAFSHRFAPKKGSDDRDPTVDAMLATVGPNDSVLDVGAGGGRIALPLTQKCRWVVAVEPSESMRQQMLKAVEVWRPRKLSIVTEKWEDANVEPADVVICAHVLYTVPEPVAFVRKLADKAKRLVVVVLFERSAASTYFPLWPTVHGQERLSLPCLPDFVALLDEMGIKFTREKLPPREPGGFADADEAVAESMARLFVAPGTEKAGKLEKVVRESLVPHEGGVRFKWAAAQQPWVVKWTPRPLGASLAGAQATEQRKGPV